MCLECFRSYAPVMCYPRHGLEGRSVLEQRLRKQFAAGVRKSGLGAKHEQKPTQMDRFPRVSVVRAVRVRVCEMYY